MGRKSILKWISKKILRKEAKAEQSKPPSQAEKIRKRQKNSISNSEKKITVKIFRKMRKTKKSKFSSKQIPSAPMLYFAFFVESGFFRPHSKMPQRLEKLCKVSIKR